MLHILEQYLFIYFSVIIYIYIYDDMMIAV